MIHLARQWALGCSETANTFQPLFFIASAVVLPIAMSCKVKPYQGQLVRHPWDTTWLLGENVGRKITKSYMWKKSNIYFNTIPFQNARKNILCEVNSWWTEKYSIWWNTLKWKYLLVAEYSGMANRKSLCSTHPPSPVSRTWILSLNPVTPMGDKDRIFPQY